VESVRKGIEKQREIPISLGESTVHERIVYKKELKKNADAAPYRAQEGGKNRVEVAPGLPSKI
jgi:GGDEF domain-containing protein